MMQTCSIQLLASRMVGDIQRLVCPQFEQQSSSLLARLLSDSIFQDVTLVSEDRKQMKAHKAVLSACSEFLKDILREMSNVSTHPVIFLKGVSSENLAQILQFVYLGEASIDEQNLEKFLQASEDLGICAIDDMFNDENVSRKQSNTDTNEKNMFKRPRLELHDIVEKSEISNNSMEDDDDDEIVEIIEETTTTDGSSEEPLTHYCDNHFCDFETSDSEQYDEHMRNHESDIKCRECSFYAKTKEIIKEHMTTEHKGIPCGSCGQKFSEVTLLRKHVFENQDCKANLLK